MGDEDESQWTLEQSRRNQTPQDSWEVCCNWRAGASQPSRSAGTIFLYIIYIFVCMSPYRNLLRNSKYTSSEISCTPCLAHAQIYILRVSCTTAGRFARCWL